TATGQCGARTTGRSAQSCRRSGYRPRQSTQAGTATGQCGARTTGRSAQSCRRSGYCTCQSAQA
ncbi:electron transport complex protein RnfC, partial [Escherichia coli B671]